MFGGKANWGAVWRVTEERVRVVEDVVVVEVGWKVVEGWWEGEPAEPVAA